MLNYNMTFIVEIRTAYLGPVHSFEHPWCKISFNKSAATLTQSNFNTAVSSVQEAMEWSYKEVKQQFTIVDFSRMLKVWKVPFALQNKISELFWNLKVCLQGGGQAGKYCECKPPTIDQYLSPRANWTILAF